MLVADTLSFRPNPYLFGMLQPDDRYQRAYRHSCDIAPNRQSLWKHGYMNRDIVLRINRHAVHDRLYELHSLFKAQVV